MGKKPASTESNKQSEGSAPPDSEAESIASGDADSQEARNDNAPGHSDAKGSIDLLESIGEEMPAVQQHAIDAENADANAAAENSGGNNAPNNSRSNSGGPVDSQGNTFDPAIHENDNGKPRLNAAGKLLRKRGRKSGGANKPQSKLGPESATPNSGGQTAEAQNLAEKCRATGAVTAELIFAVGQAAGGEEWAPRKDPKIGLDERAHMAGAWTEYYIATGIVELPPWLGVCVALSAYATPRFFMPKTQERARSWREKIYTWWARRKARKENAAREKRNPYPYAEENSAASATVPLTP